MATRQKNWIVLSNGYPEYGNSGCDYPVKCPAWRTGFLKKHLKVPVICLLQDEDAFVDGMEEPYSKEAWDLLRKCCTGNRCIYICQQDLCKTYRSKAGILMKIRINTVYMGTRIKGFSSGRFSP